MRSGRGAEAVCPKGSDATGVTLNQTDGKVCQALGYSVPQMDRSFLDITLNVPAGPDAYWVFIEQRI